MGFGSCFSLDVLYLGTGSEEAAGEAMVAIWAGLSTRYPSRVRMRYFCAFSPTSFTVMARQPRFGLG